MTGRVVDDGRALLEVTLRHPTDGRVQTFDAWVDTAFTGDFVLPRGTIAALALPEDSTGQAYLADGSPVEIHKHAALLDWFGRRIVVEVIANDGQNPLFGVGLLLGHKHTIDNASKTLTLD